jgi:molybdenum cofactor guanylyltransferase
MNVLGAILAGGQSRRFGSDKAAALLRGKPLMGHVVDVLLPQVNALVVIGRDWPGLVRVNDMPEAGLGPLGGLAGALDHAAQNGFDAVLTSGCDTPDLPDDLVARLSPGPSVIGTLPIIGLWPVSCLAVLQDWLGDAANRSVYGFADKVGARRVIADISNINRPADLPG